MPLIDRVIISKRFVKERDTEISISVFFFFSLSLFVSLVTQINSVCSESDPKKYMKTGEV